MKKIFMVSERQFDKLVPDISDDARMQLWEIWRDDLSAKMSKEELIVNANGLLTYFGSFVLVTDVDWDERGSCFEWEVELVS